MYFALKHNFDQILGIQNGGQDEPAKVVILPVKTEASNILNNQCQNSNICLFAGS